MRRTIHRVIVSPHRVVANRPSSPRIPSRCRSEKPKRPSNAHHLSRRRTATARARHRRRPPRARIFFSSPVISRCHLARAVASRRALTDSHRINHTHHYHSFAREGELKLNCILHFARIRESSARGSRANERDGRGRCGDARARVRVRRGRRRGRVRRRRRVGETSIRRRGCE